MNKVVAIVVTYNRKELLLKNIEALLNQTIKNFDILIVDNDSNDGTYNELQDYLKNQRIRYINTGKNLGGAGGFEFGLTSAVNLSYEKFWLMDDDTIPTETAYEELVKSDEILHRDYGFLSSVVLWKDDSYCLMNRQKIKKPWYGKGNYLSYALLPTYYATFVSFFITIETIKKIGFPIKEFFIWGDDVEYSTRIAKQNDCYIVLKSVVKHETLLNTGSSIEKDSKERISRYYYAYRNEMYIAKRDGIKGLIYQIIKIIYHLFKILFFSKNNRMKKIYILFKGTIKGIFFNPKVKYLEK